MAGPKHILRCLLGAHGLFLCLLLCGVASAQPGDNNVEEILMELSSTSTTGNNAFRLLVQRAQLVITGLMHISILVLPRIKLTAPQAAADGTEPAAGQATKSVKGSRSAAGKSKNSAARDNAKTAAQTDPCCPPPGFPADGSDIHVWEQVNSALDVHASAGLDWNNCCAYQVTESHGATAQSTPSYPVSATAAHYAAMKKKEAIICNDYDSKGLHFADWRALHASGAKSMAAAPMYSDDQLIGVLTLASSEVHAFDRPRVVWLLAMVTAPFAGVLHYTSQALQIESIVRGLMPSLLEQNYLRNAGLKRGKPGTSSSSSSSLSAAGQAAGVVSCSAVGTNGKASESSSGKNSGLKSADVAAANSFSSSTTSSTSFDHYDAQNNSTSTGKTVSSSRQFAEHAEVLITGSPAAATAMAGMKADASSSMLHKRSGKNASNITIDVKNPASIVSAAQNNGHNNSNGQINNHEHSAAADILGQPIAANSHSQHKNSHRNTNNANSNKTVSSKHQIQSKPTATATPHIVSSSASAAAAAALPLKANGSASLYTPAPAGSRAVSSHHAPGTSTAAAILSLSSDAYLSAYDSDLDWGDFFFNLISMCIVYAYFSEAAVAGENQGAVIVSMCIAAVDIVLLGLRWMWYEQYITYGSRVLQLFQLYRLIVLPVANTWMSWSLLNKLGLQLGGKAVASLGGGICGLLVMGVRVRSLLHAPLQLASVLFAASSTNPLCTVAFGSTSGLRCVCAVSMLQLTVGVAVPAILVHVLDARTGVKQYLPHVQAKRWLVQP